MRPHLLGIVTCLMCPMLMAAPPKPTFRAGAATSNITPPLGSPIVGGFLAHPATNIHDELHARCLVLDDGQTKLALVALDLLLLDHNLGAAARKLIEQETGIPAQNVLISAVHTHSATLGPGRGPFPFTRADQQLSGLLSFGASSTACDAPSNRLRPAQLAFTTARSTGARLQSPLVPQAGHHAAQSLRRDRPSEDESAGGQFRSWSSRPGPLTPRCRSWPCANPTAGRSPSTRPMRCTTWDTWHGVTSRPIISACTAEEWNTSCTAMKQDPPMVAMMANGASGDINNINFLHPRPRKKPYEQMRFVADDLADEGPRRLGQG